MLLLPLGKCRSEMSHTAWAVVGRLTACNRATAVNSYRRFSLYKESGKPSRSCTSVSNLPRGCSFASSCGHSASLTGASSYSLEWPELHTSRGYSSMKGRSGLRPPKKAHWTKLKFTQECDPQSVFNRLKWVCATTTYFSSPLHFCEGLADDFQFCSGCCLRREKTRFPEMEEGSGRIRFPLP